MKTLKILATSLLCLTILVPSPGTARINQSKKDKKTPIDGLYRSPLLNGSTVHNVGELQMHVGNWGQFGSWPGSGFDFSEAPSAQWPAGSGIEYLFVAGLWVGAMKGTVPAVSTSAYQFEFWVDPNPLVTMYRTSEGARNGSRSPAVTADDDRDGLIDEDWLNGFDDDGDGLIDEDFAAISKQMFSCEYLDYTDAAIQVYPQHNPLEIDVRQESYQWEEDRFDDFVGANFWITNAGNEVLEDIYIGFFADGDAGARNADNYWQDDASGFRSYRVECTDLGPVSIDVGFTYDADGDEGMTPGYFGILFLGHTTDPTGETAPERVSISTYANFSGDAAFDDGGDPSNDFERYELLSSQTIERDALIPRDYRMMICAGPFGELLPGSTLVFQTGFSIGLGLNGLRRNAAAAQLTYAGAWFNLDGNSSTGIAGRETPVKGPADVVIDSCVEGLENPFTYSGREPIWINNDCVAEDLFQERCNYTLADSAIFKTGVGGNEAQINWIIGTAPPPPVMRIDDLQYDGVVVYWDNFSETVPDVKTQKFDFEGYRVWRADNWDRPIGTSQQNGPAHELWKLLFEVDIVNGFGADVGLDAYRYEPLRASLSPIQRDDMVESTRQFLIEHPGQDPPCPQGLTTEECDTVVALAYWELGSRRGRQYYRYVDKLVHRGRPYFYAVTASDHNIGADGRFEDGKVGDPASNFVYIEPRVFAQLDYRYDESEVYVVPNPATAESMSDWQLSPNNLDPTGIKVEFRNLPADVGVIKIYTIAGDLVRELPFDGSLGIGTVRWDLVSRNAQDVTSGVYLYSVEVQNNAAFARKIGKFVVIR